MKVARDEIVAIDQPSRALHRIRQLARSKRYSEFARTESVGSERSM